MKKFLFALGLIGLISWLTWPFYGKALTAETFNFGIQKRIFLKNYDWVPDGISAFFCGTGTPMPDHERSGPCLAVIAGEEVFLFDAGEGAEENLTLMGVKPSNINHVFLTHYHSDHIVGLGSLPVQRTYWGGDNSALKVYGGPGIDRVTSGFNTAYSLDRMYRSEHHGDVMNAEQMALAPVEVVLEGDQVMKKVFDSKGVKVFAFKVDHDPVYPALGYRVEYGGRSLCMSGDTTITPTLIIGCKDADLMVSEAVSPAMTKILQKQTKKHGFDRLSAVMGNVHDYHMTPDQISQVAVEAGVSQVALTHLIPPMPFSILEELFLGRNADEFPVRTTIMNDGEVISLPLSGGDSHSRVF